MAKVQWRNPDESAPHQLNAAVKPVSFSNLHRIDQPGFILFPFHSEQGYLFTHSDQSDKDCEFPIRPKSSNNTSELDYTSAVQSALKAFNHSELSKVVLARQWSTPASELEDNALFNALCNKYPSAFVYTIVWDGVTLFGASPELLIEHRDAQLTSMALAGTKPNSEQAYFTQKEVEEQEFVQRFIEEIATGLDLDLVRKSERYEKDAGHLKHLCNDYQWTSQSISQVVQFLQSLHPTPAVAGTPKPLALQFINQYEQFNRGFYSGFLGEWSPKHQRIFVNLRCGLQHEANQFLYAGAGISADSNPESEWLETTEKLKTLSSVLSLIQDS